MFADGMAVSRNTRSPHTIGVPEPRPGTSTFQRTFFVSLHTSGGSALGATPVASGPRHWAHAPGSATEAERETTASQNSSGSMMARRVMCGSYGWWSPVVDRQASQPQGAPVFVGCVTRQETAELGIGTTENRFFHFANPKPRHVAVEALPPSVAEALARGEQRRSPVHRAHGGPLAVDYRHRAVPSSGKRGKKGNQCRLQERGVARHGEDELRVQLRGGAEEPRQGPVVFGEIARNGKPIGNTLPCGGGHDNRVRGFGHQPEHALQHRLGAEGKRALLASHSSRLAAT